MPIKSISYNELCACEKSWFSITIFVKYKCTTNISRVWDFNELIYGILV